MSHVELREFSADDAGELQALLESDPGYTERVTGYPPGSSDAVSLLLGRPEGLADKDKVVLGGWAGDELVSVVDVLRGWPDEHTAHIGLLLVRGNRQGAGLGAATFRALADRARDWAGIRSWRAAVVRTNEQVAGFWRGLGFAETGEVKPYRYDRLSSQAVIFARAVDE